jgi:hypothetical protein
MAMNKLSIERRAQIIACLVEGSSVRATCRLTHSSKVAVFKLVEDAGKERAQHASEESEDGSGISGLVPSGTGSQSIPLN